MALFHPMSRSHKQSLKQMIVISFAFLTEAIRTWHLLTKDRKGKVLLHTAYEKYHVKRYEIT